MASILTQQGISALARALLPSAAAGTSQRLSPATVHILLCGFLCVLTFVLLYFETAVGGISGVVVRRGLRWSVEQETHHIYKNVDEIIDDKAIVTNLESMLSFCSAMLCFASRFGCCAGFPFLLADRATRFFKNENHMQCFHRNKGSSERSSANQGNPGHCEGALVP
jgi:hypothetical protein